MSARPHCCLKPTNISEIPVLTSEIIVGFQPSGPDSPAAMEKAKRTILILGGGLSFVLIILWPCLALPAEIFSLSCDPQLLA